MKEIRLGLMGCGTVANYGHMPAILATPGLKIAALFDPNAKAVEAMGGKFNVPGQFTNQDDFFHAGLDAVTITSPAPYHCDNVLAAAKQSLHVLVEKPLAINDTQGRRMIRAMEKAGKLLAVGFDYRFSPVSLTIRKLIKQGAIGKPLSLRLIYIWNNHGKYQQAPSGKRIANARRVGRMEEGGPMVDCGVHQIDLARFWLDSEVVAQQAHGAWVDDFEAPDHMHLHLDHASGAHTAVEISYSYHHTAREPLNLFTYDIIGTKGVIRFDRGAKVFELRNDKGTTTLPFAGEKNFAGMYQAFVKAVRTGKLGPLPGGQDGLEASRIATTATAQAIARRKRLGNRTS